MANFRQTATPYPLRFPTSRQNPDKRKIATKRQIRRASGAPNKAFLGAHRARRFQRVFSALNSAHFQRADFSAFQRAKIQRKSGAPPTPSKSFFHFRLLP